MGILEVDKYGDFFHELFINSYDCRRKTHNDRKLHKKHKEKVKNLQNKEQNPPENGSTQLRVDVGPNASKFAVYSAVRSAVLEAETKLTLIRNSLMQTNVLSPCCHSCYAICRNGLITDCRCHFYSNQQNTSKQQSTLDNDSDVDSDLDDFTEKEVGQTVPQIVGAGLSSLFQLIAEARNVHPSLCTKALKALFDVIQGQSPESFMLEPVELMNSLYELLLDLATLNGPSTQDRNDANNWSAIGCSALLGLCVARGDTGKLLRAIAAMFMSPKNLAGQYIKFPTVLSSLQRSVYLVALGKPNKPSYFKNGIPKNALIDQFHIKNQLQLPNLYNHQPSIASDGKYLYCLLSKSLLKIGTGFNGTLKGFVYAINNEFGKEKSGWLGYCNNVLYYKRLSKRNTESLLIVNTETLTITSQAQITTPTTRDGQYCVLFSDGDTINAICSTKDDSLIVKQLYSSDVPVFDLSLKLSRKNFRTLGYAMFEDEVINQNQIQKIQSSYNPFEPKLPNELEVLNIMCGKEFGLVRTTNGKIYYYGKAPSLGLKAIGKSPNLKMTELIISKVSNIVQIAIGHDGIHALLVNDDGSVYFTGTARRGEDGDSSKNRRQPKAVKPKKISKIDGYNIINVSCNNGTSAFVTKTGKLIMFGKDTSHCDASGHVTELMDHHITKVSLGKAHCVALNSKGHLFTFGLNNKGQCGRVFVKDKEVGGSAMETSDTKSNEPKFKLDMTNMCDPEEHTVVQGQCKVCPVCKECTGYNISCVSTLHLVIEERIGGSNCPCGHGDAGCSKCGSCSVCISMQENESPNNPNKEMNHFSILSRRRSKSLLLRKKDKKTSLIEEVNISSDVERDAPRVVPLCPQKVNLSSQSPIVQISCGLQHTVVLTLAGEVFTFGSNQYGQLGTGDLQPVSGPIQVKVQGMISQVSAGSNHTVLLTHKGIVYTFGNYQKGQLGRLPSDSNFNTNQDILNQTGVNSNDEQFAGSSSINAQRQKFLWNCTPAPVYGIGPNYGKRASWIGASGDQTFIKIDESLVTGQMLSKFNVVADKNTILLIPNIKLSFNCLSISRRDGSCIAHNSNQYDFLKLIEPHSESLAQFQSDKCNQNLDINQQINDPEHQLQINQHQLDRMTESIHEARNQLLDLEDNICKINEPKKSVHPQHHHNKNQQKSLMHKYIPQLAFVIDINYGVLWAFDGLAKKLLCFNIIASEIINNNYTLDLQAILMPDIALPIKCEEQITRSQASLNLLACLDILTSAHDNIPNCFEKVDPPTTLLQAPLPTTPVQSKEISQNEYQIVSRFHNFGGGWGYSGHSVEAIRFMSDTDIVVGGVGMFGGRGEYSCKIKIFDLGYDGGGHEKEGILLIETDEVPFECPARCKYNVMLNKVITVNAGKWYLIWSRVSGPSSDCGSSGQGTVTTEDQVVFSFKSSKKANNGTDVNSGQIPSLLYKIITQETKQIISIDLEPIHKISKMFASTVTMECFESLVLLLNWAWSTFKVTLNELKDKKKLPQTMATLERLVYINKTCLRLLKKFINKIYPHRINYSFNRNDKTFNSKSPYDNDYNKLNNLPTTSRHELNTLSMDANTPTNPKKSTLENLQLAECIGDIRFLLIQILSDEFQQNVDYDGILLSIKILDECHVTFVSCFNAFYPTSSLKWNCLCDLLSQIDKGVLHARFLSAVVAGLCNPTVKLRSTFSLLSPNRESKSIVSPCDNSGLPMLLNTKNHQYPILVEQMLFRTQQERKDFLTNSWHFKDVLIRLLDIITYPIKTKIGCNNSRYNSCLNNYNNCIEFYKHVNQGLIDNCCHLLARVLAEIVYQCCTADFDISLLPSRSLYTTGTRFSRCDVSRTWNTGNFGPDAIAFTVDRPGIAITGAMVYSGTGNYEFQLELLYDTMDSKSQSQTRWETLESTSGTYTQEVVHGDMAEIKFERPIHIKEHSRYALRLCSHGARTCSGDSGQSSIRGPDGTTFTFYRCDLSFNGTTPLRGQIPCILYFSSPLSTENYTGKILNEIHARDTALQIASVITKRCSEILIYARNIFASSSSPSDKSPNSSNNTQTIDSEHNITPIEEHLDITWTNNSNTTENNLSTARDLTKRFETFSKGIMETLKFDKRCSTNPFEFEIEIGATEITQKDLLEENEINDRNMRNGKFANTPTTPGVNPQASVLNPSKLNGNRVLRELNEVCIGRKMYDEIDRTDSEDSDTQMSSERILEVFGLKDASLFHSLLPLVFAHIGPLVNSDPKSSVQILSLIKEILPHVAALNQLYSNNNKDQQHINYMQKEEILNKNIDINSKQNDNEKFYDVQQQQYTTDLCTTSNHYCIVESDHPYKSAAINNYRVIFPPCVQWFTVEFDPQSGTAQPEDYLLVSIPYLSKYNSNINGNQSNNNNNNQNVNNTNNNNLSHNLNINNNYNNNINKNKLLNNIELQKNDIHEQKLNNNRINYELLKTCKNAILQTSAYSLDETSNNYNNIDKDDDEEWVIIKKFNNPSQWSQNAIVFPGNKIEFSLETASDYLRDQQANHYGFKCMIIGYDNPSQVKLPNACLMRLESELAYLGGLCSANLMKKDLILPDDKAEDLQGIEETLTTHSTLLSKGLALPDSLLTINQALESHLPIGGPSNERQFLKDFVSGAPGSSGARLAAWLQPEPRLDPNRCELKPIQDPVRCGWPSQLTIITRDQYGDAVFVPDLKIEIKATPAGALTNGGRKLRRVSQTEPQSLGGMPLPPKISYEPTVKEKICFKAITFMKAYQPYSFEELRFCSPVQTKTTEILKAIDSKDGTFGVAWTPNTVGNYCLTVTIDGIALEEIYRVEVKDAGIPPPPKTSNKKIQPPNKIRKFITKNSAGLRIRAHPTLQSEQVGIVKMNGIITFIDELENDDGVWVRLSTESIRQHCTSGWYPIEAWCLLYNQHIGKTLLHPVIEPSSSKTLLERIRKNSGTNNQNLQEPTDCETHIEPQPKQKTGSPSKKGFEFTTSKFTPPLSSDSGATGLNPFIFTSTTPPKGISNKAHNDAKNASALLFPEPRDNDEINRQNDQQYTLFETKKFDHESITSHYDDHKMQQSSSHINLSPNPNQTNIGTTIAGVVGGGASKLQALHKWFKGDSIETKEISKKRNDFSELASVSVRDLVKAIGGQDTKSNGNGATPPHLSRSSSPVAIPAARHHDLHSTQSSSSRSVEVSDTSALISSLPRDLSQSPSQASIKEEGISDSPKLSILSEHQHDSIKGSNFSVTSGVGYNTASSGYGRHDGSPKINQRKIRNKRSISPCYPSYSQSISPSGSDKIKSDSKTDGSPCQTEFNFETNQASLNQNVFDQKNATINANNDKTDLFWQQQMQNDLNNSEKPLPESKPDEVNKPNMPKRALPPSLAESLRAVFAAFLWHEGIVHDAMACASFLKFHPTLPKQGALVVTQNESESNKILLTKEQKAQQRHSVEVATAGTYLNIRPSTLESLTKSGNSSILNRRYRKNGSNSGETIGLEPDKTKLHSLPEIVTVLPPALRCLVYLWEQLCSNCLQSIQETTLKQAKESSLIKPIKPSRDQTDNVEKESKKLRKKKKVSSQLDDGLWCELCEVFLTIPVTSHMRIVHPGCGKITRGKGYNSVGTFCEGWAGNCGEGGKGASSWYLMCDKCRDKYTNGRKNVNNINSTTTNLNSPNSTNVSTTSTITKLDNLISMKTSLVLNAEVYSMMKENAMFLLELSSTNGSLNGNQKRSPQQMPIVSENQSSNPIRNDINRPSTSRGDTNNSRNSFVAGSTQQSKSKFNNKIFNDINNDSIGGRPINSTPLRKNSTLPTCISPELLWQAPDGFSCLEYLGASITNDLPYEIFGLTDNGYDRPLSEISFESVGPNAPDILNQSITNATSSRFHRSLSMGQGWLSNFNNTGTTNRYYPPQNNDNDQPDSNNRVVFRRKNNSSCDADSGSLLLCNPSTNLRKLCPEYVLSSSCVVQSATPKPLEQQKSIDIVNNIISSETADQMASATSTKPNDFVFPEYNYLRNIKTIDHSKSQEVEDTQKKEKPLEDIKTELLNKSVADNNVQLMQRPTMIFIMQHHNLDKLKYALKRSLRITTCRIYSLQALNWLIRSVTHSNALHDLMWWFVTSLTPASGLFDENFKLDDEQALEHPVTSTQMSGRVSFILSQSLHTFLQTVADLTLLLPAGSALQRIAIQCFGIKFRQADHQFLHRSHVFGNISKILSKSDEQNEDMLISSSASIQDSNTNILYNPAGNHNYGAMITNLIDLNGMFELTVSSRQAMANLITDNSTETFWESDEEDRYETKNIDISLNKLNYVCKTIYIHVDNSRDINNKIDSILFYAGHSLGDMKMITCIDVNEKLGVWMAVDIRDDSFTHFRLQFRTISDTLRIRQIKLLGYPIITEENYNSIKSNVKLINATQIQQRNCETETLRVFRLITGQVFGKLILGADYTSIDNVNISNTNIMETSTTSLLADSLDLREHMVGILFSRSKLSHLQKQVIVHIVHAIRKEAQRAKEEWEIYNATITTQINCDQKSDSSSENSRSPDTYCFEMLSMVLALSGSTVGRSYLSHQHGLLKDLLILLHTGSDRVQRQVTALLRRMLPEITPESLCDLLYIEKMPPNDFNIVQHDMYDFDMNRLGIIDIFLAAIAKSLQVQVKVKTPTTNNKNPPMIKLCNNIDFNIYNLKKEYKQQTESSSQKNNLSPGFDNNFSNFENNNEYDNLIRKKQREVSKNLNQRWFLKGTISFKQAENIIGLIKDMVSGKMTEKWSLVTKAAIAESILNLTRLDEVFRIPENCVKTATMWLALASLCVLDKEHVERLSSGQWSKTLETRPMCTNHDDSITSAVIQCDSCGSLCIDCDRYLHLNRKTRIHRRTVCKEEEEAIRVELHEGCGRTKLFWLLALADSKTLKGIVEFRDGNNTIITGPTSSIGRCRFCGLTEDSGLLAVGNVCADAQCQEYAANACAKIRPCGHPCSGVANEVKCLPCLQHICLSRENEIAETTKDPKLTQDADDMCMICFVEALSCAPSIQLQCGHVFHFHCCKAVILKRWTGPRISFGFSQCPICKTDIYHVALKEILEPIVSLKNDVKKKALMRYEYEGIIKKNEQQKDLYMHAMDRYAYYVCFKCQKAYYGGEARCDVEMGENFDPQELVCGACSDVAKAKMCPKHGTDYLEYKCRFCCSVAVFFCFGTTHFCDTCHDDFQHLTDIPKNKLPRCPAGPRAKQLVGEECPLHVVHPSTGEEYALGCGICRNAHTF